MVHRMTKHSIATASSIVTYRVIPHDIISSHGLIYCSAVLGYAMVGYERACRDVLWYAALWHGKMCYRTTYYDMV